MVNPGFLRSGGKLLLSKEEKEDTKVRRIGKRGRERWTRETPNISMTQEMRSLHIARGGRVGEKEASRKGIREWIHMRKGKSRRIHVHRERVR